MTFHAEVRGSSPDAEDGAVAAVVGGLCFKFAWRPYQERVLAAANRHFRDGRLHIVAASGAGKTSLGLEVFRRLAKPCLVLSPTRTIRNQWIARIEDFIPEGTCPFELPWVSRSLDAPAVFTSVTYQALHAGYCASMEAQEETNEADGAVPESDVLQECAARIRRARIGTIILDEAHHLHAEWWKALKLIADQVDGLRMVCLTATPPYDVVGDEWRRYLDLCGPIDQEISAPELIHAGNLCPHQDYLYLVGLGEANRIRVEAYENSVANAISTLASAEEFHSAVLDHPWMREEGFDIAAALDSVTLLVSLLVFRKHAGEPLPSHCLIALDAAAEDVPDMSRYWWNTLVNGFLFHGSFALSESQAAYQKWLGKELRAKKLLERHDLYLSDSRPLQRTIATAEEKVEACAAVCRIEREVRGPQLRQVILTDFIRDEEGLDMASSKGGLGAWPVFRAIHNKTPQEERRYIALLTGRLVMIHEVHRDSLHERVDAASFAPVSDSPDLLQVIGDTGAVSAAVTAMLQAGQLRVVVGTRALLGEGWDCPAVNSVVLGTAIGSFVMTNQMRGRAVRVDAMAPAKAASVWHIAAVAPSFTSGLCDYASLTRRFNTFVGLHHQEPVIEGGILRLGLPDAGEGLQGTPFPSGLDNTNAEMVERLRADTLDLGRRWKKAIESATEYQVIPSVGMPVPRSRTVHFRNTLCWYSLGSLMIFVAGGIQVWQYGGADSLVGLLLVLGITFIVAQPSLRSLLSLLRRLSVGGSIRRIGQALCDALCDTGVITTERGRLKVVARERTGEWTISLAGADYYEQSVFADSLNEVLAPIENPRYLITRRARGQTDYHAVPSVLGGSKERAGVFCRHWKRRVAKGDLIYTRSPNGRALLLKARGRSFSSGFVGKSRRLSRWQ